MSAGEKSPVEKPSALAAAMREVKNAAADRDDVVIEMREAERMRLELFAAELAPVIADVPTDLDLFDFAISSGLQPRFWIDAVSHVSMGRDKRTFRFVRDTRLGRVVLAESGDLKSVASQVTTYIAERLVERQRLMEGDVASVRHEAETIGQSGQPSSSAVATSDAPPVETTKDEGWKPFLSGLGVVLLGALVAGVAAVSFYWDRIDLSRLGLDRFGF